MNSLKTSDLREQLISDLLAGELAGFVKTMHAHTFTRSTASCSPFVKCCLIISKGLALRIIKCFFVPALTRTHFIWTSS